VTGGVGLAVAWATQQNPAKTYIFTPFCPPNIAIFAKVSLQLVYTRSTKKSAMQNSHIRRKDSSRILTNQSVRTAARRAISERLGKFCSSILMASASVVTPEWVCANARWTHSRAPCHFAPVSRVCELAIGSKSYDQSPRISFALIASAAFPCLRGRSLLSEKFTDASFTCSTLRARKYLHSQILRPTTTRLPLQHAQCHCTPLWPRDAS
jgi:hypothetical protein